jgi:uncharacterized protein involved in exopolysaccharide biosynthesis
MLTKIPFESVEDRDPFENTLQKLLTPRQANPVFVKKLKNRLLSQPYITVEKRKQYKAFWIIAAGLFSGVLALFLLSLRRKKISVSEQ